MKRSRSAFTLIELLVVVAIIGLLISILLPSLQGARKQSRQLLCTTNLRSQGQASYFYAEENKDWIACGLVGFAGTGGEYYTYALSVLKGLGNDEDTRGLWTGGSPNEQKKYRRLLGKTKQLQCPDHPGPATPTVGIGNPDPELGQPLDYISSAMPIPYNKKTVDADASASAQVQPDQPRVQGTNIDDYTPLRKLEHVAGVANPGAVIFVTEGSRFLSDVEMRFHHFFLTSQLSYGVNPRVANDQRHPGGLANLFWDGHVEVIGLKQLDAGWGNSLGKRLRYFSVQASDVPDSDWN